MVINTEFQSIPVVELRDRFQFLNAISPLERWEDDNYQPIPLKVEFLNTETHFLVKAELPGVSAEQVKVDLCRGTLFILVSPKADNGTSEEQYVEVSIPSSYRTDKARMVFSHGALIIVVATRRPEILKRLRSALTALLPQPHLLGTEGIPSGD